MPKFHLTGTVTREITDTVSLSVEAETEAHAHAIAEKVLETFPDGHEEGEVVSYCYIEDRQYGEANVEVSERAVIG